MFYEEKANGLMIRSKTRWTEKGERPTKYFFNLEKRNYSRKNIAELELPNGKHLHEADEILKKKSKTSIKTSTLQMVKLKMTGLQISFKTWIYLSCKI